jgi:MoaA/NifB/PqqE/SkfB family radical SAM enzyme
MKKTVKFSKKARNIFFHILTECNLSCKHCYINKNQHGAGMLDIEKIKAWLKIFATKDKENNLILLGGEPTLHPELNIVVKEAKKLDYASITIDTNGFLFFDILSKINPNELDFISFSIDGPTKEINDKIRGSGSFDACILGLKKAKNAGFNTSVIYTVSADNIDDLKKMPSLLNTLDINRFFIQVIGLRGNSAKDGFKQAQVQKDMWLNIVPDIAKKIADTGIIVTYPKVYLENDELFECAGLLAENYFIFPNGRVYRCPLCEDFPIHGFEIDSKNKLIRTPSINETDLFNLSIPEGCVINKIVQPKNIAYKENGEPAYKIACCMLKEEIF